MTMGKESKVEYLIVDTSAFIKCAALQDIGNKVITEPGVVSEITSKRQLKRLVVLPYDLKVEEAFPEDVKFVTEFAKKTGDYASLSATDIKVIALTYRYERERVGTSHLKQVPEKKYQTVDSSVKNPQDRSSKPPVGFYMPEGDNNDGCADSDNEEASSENDEERNEQAELDMKNISEMFQKLKCDPEDLKLFRDDLTADDILKPVKDDGNDDACSFENHSDKAEKEEDDGNDDDDDDDDDDDAGWITPQNIKDARKQMDSGIVKEKPATVACLTMDYAMQNVLMQIGLNVASLEGKVIKEMRTFILRCYSCFKTTGMVEKIFCPNCGNKTLKKVAVSLDDEGKQIIHINFKKTLTARGKKFSLPTYQGGKHACNPLLFDDQPMPDQRPTKLGRAKTNPLDEDYTAGFSPFVTRDVNSRAAMLNIKSSNTIKHWMRRNPNEVRKHRK